MLQAFEETNENVQVIADRFEINGVLTDLATAFDSGALDELNNIFTPSAAIDLSLAGGCKGFYADVKESLSAVKQLFPGGPHQVCSADVRITDDFVRSITRCQGAPNLSGESAERIYHDKFLRTPAGWRIVERVLRENRP